MSKMSNLALQYIDDLEHKALLLERKKEKAFLEIVKCRRELEEVIAKTPNICQEQLYNLKSAEYNFAVLVMKHDAAEEKWNSEAII